MENIIEVLKASNDLSAGKGASAEQIDAASKSLGLAFAEDYLMYLEEFGLAYVWNLLERLSKYIIQWQSIS